MRKDHYIIVGTGPAGHSAALTLRKEDQKAQITLINKENKGCYHPHLLPTFIAGEIDERSLYVSPVTAYKERNIKLRSGQQVVHINLKQRHVVMEHKEVIPFSGLIIAVGGRPRIPERLLHFQDLMLTLKTVEDGRRWAKALQDSETILIVGGDLTSFAVTEALLQLKRKIYFMLNEDAFWPLRCDDVLLGKVGQKLKTKGVDVLTCRRIRGMSQRSDNIIEVLVNGEKIVVNMIGAFFGLVPDVRFLARSGLQIDRGILVDETLNTGFNGIYATGDCAQIYHPAIKDYWVSIGHENAVQLGKVAALNLLGGRVAAAMDQECITDVQGIKVNTSWWEAF
jgi:NADPH-dependent 2,4-dienoyl-CoA reductase/sulfur reductase-like enzyme